MGRLAGRSSAAQLNEQPNAVFSFDSLSKFASMFAKELQQKQTQSHSHAAPRSEKPMRRRPHTCQRPPPFDDPCARRASTNLEIFGGLELAAQQVGTLSTRDGHARKTDEINECEHVHKAMKGRMTPSQAHCACVPRVVVCVCLAHHLPAALQHVLLEEQRQTVGKTGHRIAKHGETERGARRRKKITAKVATKKPKTDNDQHQAVSKLLLFFLFRHKKIATHAACPIIFFLIASHHAA